MRLILKWYIAARAHCGQRSFVAFARRLSDLDTPLKADVDRRMANRLSRGEGNRIIICNKVKRESWRWCVPPWWWLSAGCGPSRGRA